MPIKESALVLFSGGMDSTTLLYDVLASYEFVRVEVIIFDYDQRHKVELECAMKILDHLAECGKIIPHTVIKVDLRQFGGSLLTEDNKTLPMIVPARNSIFLSMATALAETRGLDYLYIGPTKEDYEDFPDCHPAFINLMGRALSYGNKIKGVQAPFGHLSKEKVVERGKELGVPYHLTWSCYTPTEDNRPCNECHACLERNKVL